MKFGVADYGMSVWEGGNFDLKKRLRKTLKTKGVFPNDDSVFKILYLSLKRISSRWTMPIPTWKTALNQLVIKFGDRIHF